ncbi:ester cyclase [Kribbella deserti]|uniref:Ester cyclase n=1 Tax=Kribbella deserti TaxID=1926257 RepID=A0ABV6QTK7_9ACTN
MKSERDELVTFYRRYLACSNERRFDDLGEFVDENVRINGNPAGLKAYADGLREVVEAFPDYHWDLQHLLVDGDWLSAHLIDTATHTGTPFLGIAATGRLIRIHELAIYRLDNRRIIDCWGDLGSAARDHLTQGSPPIPG